MVNIDSLQHFSFTRLGGTISPQRYSTTAISGPYTVVETYRTHETVNIQDGQGPAKYLIYYLPPMLSKVHAKMVTYWLFDEEKSLIFLKSLKIKLENAVVLSPFYEDPRDPETMTLLVGEHDNILYASFAE